MRTNWRTLFIFAAATTIHMPVSAGFLVEGPIPENSVPQASHQGANANVSLSPTPVQYLTEASTLFRDTLADQFPGWTFNYAVPTVYYNSYLNLNGTLTIQAYKATANENYGGAQIYLEYERANTDPIIDNLRWIQLVNTSDPLPDTPNPVIDPYESDEDPELPFYWDINGSDPTYIDSHWKTGDTYFFGDEPKRPYPTPPVPPALINGLTWSADLHLASWDGTLTNGVGSVTIYDGISWGFLIQKYPPSNNSSGNRPSLSGADRWSSNLTAVPEPNSLTLVLCGVVVLAIPIFVRGSWMRQHFRSRRRVLFLFFFTFAMVILGFSFRHVSGRADIATKPRPYTSLGNHEFNQRACVLHAKLAKHVYRIDDPILLTAEILNNGNLPVTIYKCSFWPNHRVIVTNEQGDELPLTQEGERHLTRFVNGAYRDRNLHIVLEGGESNREGPVDISALYHYVAGRYQVEVIYSDPLPPTPTRLVSHRIPFVIEDD